MDYEIQKFGLTQGDIYFMLSLTQIVYAVLTAGLLFHWVKSRHPGVLVSASVFGLGAYFSYINDSWLPLLIALFVGYILKGMGFNMGYH